MIQSYFTIHTKMDCSIVDIIVATVTENCLVMVMPDFDVPYQHGALDVESKMNCTDSIRQQESLLL